MTPPEASAIPAPPRLLYGIIGHPLGQTLSPLLHNWGFTRMGVAAAYVAFPTPPERLEDFIRAVRTMPVCGLSVTIPHKEAVMPLLDAVDPLAGSVGAVNTLVWEGEPGTGRLVGHNTDVAGFCAPLKRLGAIPETALVLGAGGAAKAVLAGLKELGVARVAVANRTFERAQALAETFGAMAIPWEERAGFDAALVVNTTPVGMSGKGDGLSPMPAEYWTPGHVAYDIVYNPLLTPFLFQARERGAAAIDGLAMFAGQGAAQFKLWTGLDLPLDEAKALLFRALGA
ncbi:shikimate dehydrogenase [Fundidesulfovibrio agrisoli]|uniref:shikimate dehydrogenase n=1 Tax=Fundidesulfovibrio agrisoli TaxID=2922717 RepID=UPI001FAE7003|nr:shikimate dehydrogenase [Fundidesulfovibrio agrisoli]